MLTVFPEGFDFTEDFLCRYMIISMSIGLTLTTWMTSENNRTKFLRLYKNNRNPNLHCHNYLNSTCKIAFKLLQTIPVYSAIIVLETAFKMLRKYFQDSVF